MSKFGNWNLAGQMVNNLGKDIEESNQIVLKQIALKAESIAVKHLQSQDLGWQPLKEETLKRKTRKNLSNKILIATSSYFQSITSWTSKNMAIAGVKKTAKNENGDTIADIAKVHEYGSKVRNIPARPLWRPTYDEMVKFIRSNKLFLKAFLARAKKKYGNGDIRQS